MITLSPSPRDEILWALWETVLNAEAVTRKTPAASCLLSCVELHDSPLTHGHGRRVSLGEPQVPSLIFGKDEIEDQRGRVPQLSHG